MMMLGFMGMGWFAWVTLGIAILLTWKVIGDKNVSGGKTIALVLAIWIGCYVGMFVLKMIIPLLIFVGILVAIYFVVRSQKK